MRPSLAIVALLLACSPGVGLAAADAEQAAGVQRVLMLLGGVAGEYREGLDDAGRVARPLELEEARLLLDEARDRVRSLGSVVPADLDRGLIALGGAIASHAPADEVVQRVEALRATLSDTTGIREQTLPSAPPSAARGREVFQAQCAGCHGEHGAGDGPDARTLERRPADFTDPAFMRLETPTDFFHVISVGKRKASMPAWEDVLPIQARWDAIAYLWSLGTSRAEVAEGQGAFMAQCAGCHGATADGHGPWAATLVAPVPDLSTPAGLATRSDQDLYDVISSGVPGTPMPGFARGMTERERRQAVAYLRFVSLGGMAGDHVAAGGAPITGATPESAAARFAEADRLLVASAAAYTRGETNAAELATDAYMQFEPLEKDIAARDQAAVTRVEEGFLALRSALRSPGAGDEVTRRLAQVRRDLETAGRLLEGSTDAWARFVQSTTIILREGFEIVLVIGALLAYVSRAGGRSMRRPIYAGAGLGVVASVITAALLATVFRMTPGAGEVLEGASMLLAAAVLFWVSYWIISKAEADRWQRYIQGKVKHAMDKGSPTALAAAAFLAVYREGFETVLFYRALIASAPARDAMVPAGLVVGTLLLAIVTVLFVRFGFQLPIRPFFLATGGFLYTMAIVFAGKGVHELQEAGIVSFTPLAWGPRIEFLGVFPTAESLLAQGVLIVLLVWGAWRTLRPRRAPAPADPGGLRSELARLRQLAESLQAEAARLVDTPDAVRRAELDARLEGLIDQVRNLESRVGTLP
jgi:high-affinity iron transporter